LIDQQVQRSRVYVLRSSNVLEMFWKCSGNDWLQVNEKCFYVPFFIVLSQTVNLVVVVVVVAAADDTAVSTQQACFETVL
jgi:hypothetical protein